MEGIDNLQRTVDDFKPEAWNFQATFKKNFNTKKLFKYLKIVKEREGNVACEQFYQELLSSYGKYLQVLSFLGVTKIFNV